MNKIECLLHLSEIEKYLMLMYLHLASLSMSDIFGIHIATVISLILRINFAKIHTYSKIILSITLLFGRMLSLVKRFH